MIDMHAGSRVTLRFQRECWSTKLRRESSSRHSRLFVIHDTGFLIFQVRVVSVCRTIVLKSNTSLHRQSRMAGHAYTAHSRPAALTTRD